MHESFDAYQYLHYLRRRSRFIAVICVATGVVALVVSLVLPKEYTATASILIDPPAGNDPRSSISVSPIYLESLRSYELFASSDTLFQRALEKFHLRDAQSSTPLESLKRRVLKVTKLRDTKILQIAVTLPDPKQAQTLAQFLAEETVSLNRSSNRDNDRDLLEDGQKQSDDARKRLDLEQTAWGEFNARGSVQVLREEVETLTALRERVRKDLSDARAELAEYTGRGEETRVAGIRARLESLEKQDADLQRQIESKAALLATRENRAEALQQNIRAARLAYEAAAARLRDLHASAGLRGERLRVIDPGVVPEKPSWPNIGLNVMLAVAVALISSITFLTLTFRPGKS